MRIHHHLALVFSLAAAASIRAEDRAPAVNPDPVPLFPAATQPTTARPDPTLPIGDAVPPAPAPPTILPEGIPAPNSRHPGATKSAVPGRPGATLKPPATAAEFDLRLRYRKTRNLAEANENVRAAWDESRAAKTDLRKRQTLRHYYDVLFSKMLAMDRGLTPLVEQRHKAENARLTQSQIAPTVDLE